MKEFSLKYLHCVKCNSKLELDVYSKESEIIEGMLECSKCHTMFPIIDKIPILWEDFSNYLANRRTLGGKLYQLGSEKMKKFVKSSLGSITLKIEDRTNLEDRWAKIYHNSQRSKFYSIIKTELSKLPSSNLSLEYGCSIGTVTNFLSDCSKTVFGIDRSFSAIKMAQKNSSENMDYFVADLLTPIFDEQKFDLILSLNLLELVEPMEFLNHISSQLEKGCLIISDPYDYDRGTNSVKNPMDEKSLRQQLKNYGFKITKNTINPSRIPWNLKLNQRASLNYKVDLIVAKK